MNASFKRVERWLNSSQTVWELWFGKLSVMVAWLGLMLTLVSPPHGSGFQVCWQKSTIGIPCPGCGVTRSLSCGIRGMFAESWNYHPMGLAILALFAFTAGQSLLPGVTRERLKCYVQARAATFNSLYLAFVILFVAYGIGRALTQLVIQWMK